MTDASVSRRVDRGAPVLLLALTVGAFFWYLWLGRRSWFVADEWDFVANRSASSIHDLFAPHNEHWSTVPILVFRLWFHIFGVRTYVPYLLLVLTLHLGLAWLLWLVMRRAKVQVWIATAAAALFILFGSGHDNILVAFNITFNGSLVLGMTQLLLADHDGPIDRRDAMALAAGLVGLMCSGIAVTMTVVVGLAVLTRRGWRPAALQVLPLAGVYLLWFGLIGHEGYRSRAPLTRAPRYVYDQLGATYRALGQLPGFGLLLAVVLVIGLVLLFRRTPIDELRRWASAPLALLVGALVFAMLTAFGRAVGPTLPGFPSALSPSRYEYVLAALILPALALAVSTIAALAPRWGFVLAVLFLVPIPGNVRTVVRHENQRGPQEQATRQALVGIASLPVARELPRSTLVPAAYFSNTTVGWLLAAKDAGRLPSQAPLSAARANALTQALVLENLARPSSTRRCELIRRPVESRFATGTVIVSPPGHLVDVAYLPSSGPAPPPLLLGETSLTYPAARVLVGSLPFRVRAPGRRDGDDLRIATALGDGVSVPRARRPRGPSRRAHRGRDRHRRSRSARGARGTARRSPRRCRPARAAIRAPRRGTGRSWGRLPRPRRLGRR